MRARLAGCRNQAGWSRKAAGVSELFGQAIAEEAADHGIGLMGTVASRAQTKQEHFGTDQLEVEEATGLERIESTPEA